MEFTFGIITAGNNEENINKIIDSIEKQKIPNYEIIIIGNTNINRLNTKVVLFDETIKPMWITKKKNMITEKAKYENIVYLHDYIYFADDWYKNFSDYGNDFDLCMNQILNKNGTRFRDWSLWEPDGTRILKSRNLLIPYSMTHLSKYMYFSGSYWVAKKNVMLEHKLNERIGWGDGEDSQWSISVRCNYNFSINEKSIVHLMKQKNRVFDLSNDKDIELLNKLR